MFSHCSLILGYPMKTKYLLLLVLVLGFNAAFSQKSKGKAFKGKIVYKISYEKNNLDDEVTGMLPRLMSLYIDDDKIKTDLVTELGTQSAIYDLQLKTKTALMDMMGSKYAIRDSWETIQADHEKKPKPQVVFTGETKVIAGYNCSKAVVSVKETEDSAPVESIAWFTDEIVVNPGINFGNAMFKDIQAVLMEYEMEAGNDLKMKFLAFSVEKMKISSKDFEIPEGYTEVSREELMQIFMK